MGTDRQIFKVYEEMERICCEVNDMFVAMDEVMDRKRFSGGGSLRWETSEALGNPVGWLPYFSQRLYFKGENWKKALGVNLMMKDAQMANKIPFLTCGLIISKKDIGKSDELYGAGWHEDSEFTEIPKTPFSVTRGEDGDLLTYFLRLTAVNSVEKIESLVGGPLSLLYSKVDSLSDLKRLERGLEPIKESVGAFALTLRQIKAGIV